MSDLISRQDAVSEIDEWIQMATGNGTDMAIKDFLSFLKERIESLPSAEPKTGKWRMLERDENVYDLYGIKTWGVNYMCDNCGFIHTAIQDHFSQYKHCPNCGARMTKGGEDE